MKISVETTLKTIPETFILPVTKGVDFEASMNQSAHITGLHPTWIKRHFKADFKEVQPLHWMDGDTPKTLYLLGIGELASFSCFLKSFRSFVFQNREKLTAEAGISFLNLPDAEKLPAIAEASLNGIVLGRYPNGLYKTEDRKKPEFISSKATVTLFVDETTADEVRHAAAAGKTVAETQLRVFDLVNAPANKKTPQFLAAWAEKSGKEFGYEVKVFDRKKIEKVGLHALLAVNRGSEFPPQFILLEYKPKHPQSKDLKKIGLIGKGVTFDTGGISIKPSSNMHFMKSDMGGAAAVFGAVELAARMQLPVHVIAAVPATENSVDALSYKPGDVIDSYSGKTIEVIDTDAEGRLILADGLSYVTKNYQPDVLIDLATLTGSTVQTFGYHAAALFSNHNGLAEDLMTAGDSCGERLWRMPIWDVYKDEVKSDIADIKNYHGKPTAGAIVAAKFLEAFIDNHPCWAHLDIANMAYGDSEFASQKSATGFGVRLLLEYLKKQKTDLLSV